MEVKEVKKMLEVKELKKVLRSVGAQALRGVSLRLEVLGRAKRQSRAKDNSLAVQSPASDVAAACGIVSNFFNFSNFSNFKRNLLIFSNFFNF